VSGEDGMGVKQVYVVVGIKVDYANAQFIMDLQRAKKSVEEVQDDFQKMQVNTTPVLDLEGKAEENIPLMLELFNNHEPPISLKMNEEEFKRLGNPTIGNHVILDFKVLTPEPAYYTPEVR
jgi:anion-transporting  ArsA/GET3 family ATPase